MAGKSTMVKATVCKQSTTHKTMSHLKSLGLNLNETRTLTTGSFELKRVNLKKRKFVGLTSTMICLLCGMWQHKMDVLLLLLTLNQVPFMAVTTVLTRTTIFNTFLKVNQHLTQMIMVLFTNTIRLITVRFK